MRILLINDNRWPKDRIGESLRREGFVVDIATGANDGDLMAGSYNFDAILIESVSGLDAIGVLKRVRRSSNAPVIILSQSGSVREIIVALNSGADDLMITPFQCEELTARIRALIRRSAGKPTPRIRIGEYVIDTALKQVSKSGEQCTLTAREYSLIEYLAMNYEKVVSRTELYEHLYGDDDTIFANCLEVAISRVRSKLGKRFIVTHRGLGYSMFPN